MNSDDATTVPMYVIHAGRSLRDALNDLERFQLFDSFIFFT